MDFLRNAADSVSKAVNYVMDRNRKAAIVNRLKIVIRNERENQSRAYIALGKYYCSNLRDPENETTEPLCRQAETASRRLHRAYAKLDDLTVPPEEEGSEQPQEDDDRYDDLCGGPGEEAADDEAEDSPAGIHTEEEEDEEFLRPFTVVPNDTASEGGTEDGGEDEH